MIGVLGDLHLGRSIYNYDVTPYIRESMYRFFDLCRGCNVDFAVQLGDVFDHSTPSEAHRKQVVQWFNEFERSEIPLYVLVGNHDATNDSATGSALAAFRVSRWRYVTVVDRPLTVRTRGDHVVTVLPFPSPGLYRSIHSYLKDVWQAFYNHPFITPKCQYVFSHLMVEGAAYGSQDFVYRGGDYSIPDYVTRSRSMNTKVICGHIHKGQTVNKRVHVVGSANRLRFDEQRDKKHILLIDGGKLKRVMQPSLQLVEVKLDVSNNKELRDTSSVIAYLKKRSFDDCIVKVTSVVDTISSVDWSAIEDTIYSKRARWVHLMAPDIRQPKIGAAKRIRQQSDTLAIAKQFIKHNVNGKSEKQLAYKLFKKLYTKAIYNDP
jgi:DNA repair exonuclease SbcCD nuclease subunit